MYNSSKFTERSQKKNYFTRHFKNSHFSKLSILPTVMLPQWVHKEGPTCAVPIHACSKSLDYM